VSQSRFRAYLMIGPPASGKGTHGKLIGALPGFAHFSMGQVLRRLRPRSEEEAQRLESISKLTARGDLAPDDYTLELFHDYLERMTASGQLDPNEDIMILDGIPRSGAQAKSIMENLDVRAAFIFQCPDADLLERIRVRSISEGRADDATLEIVQNRLHTYREELPGILDNIPEEIRQPIDTARPAHHVLRDILGYIE
jgi:adenylate kinase